MIKHKIIKSIIFIHFLCLLFSDIKAVTETGDQVILNDNGTWQYLLDPIKDIRVNPRLYLSSYYSDFLLKSKIIDIGVRLNPKKYTFNKGIGGDEEYMFIHESDEVYGMIIPENIIHINIFEDVELIKKILTYNASTVGKNTRINDIEYRNVNQNKLLYVTYQTEIDEYSFTYMVYVLSEPEIGFVQFQVYTYTDLIDVYSEEMEELLNGLVVINND
tara:strand:+ start:84 stop:734 length:651 start_codon:yes stop_codon:yes gene_type:complete